MECRTITPKFRSLITNLSELQKAIRAKAKKQGQENVDYKLANRSVADINKALSYISGKQNKITPKLVDSISDVFYDFPIALSSRAFFKFLDKLAQTLDSNRSPAYKQKLQDLVAQVVHNMNPKVIRELRDKNIERNTLYSNNTEMVIRAKLNDSTLVCS